MSFYDKCLVIIKNENESIGIARPQTDDTRNVEIEIFIKKEEREIIEAKFKAKTQTILEISMF